MVSDTDQRRNRVITLALLAILLISVSMFLTSPKESDTIVVTFPSGATLETEVADTPEKLLFGLAFREALPPSTGMLYIFETTGTHRLNTKEYKMPVDMIWLDESRHVVQLHESVPPCSTNTCPMYGPSSEPVRYVIQTAAGFIRQEGLQANAELKFALRM
ncbi:MAG TPA: DUF192 domain-containing protein [Nitrospiraceae bacterium]|nr:DUF192 domain-containing protein [Nitrospiraceae bacterium]